jgi:hypothetical protein
MLLILHPLVSINKWLGVILGPIHLGNRVYLQLDIPRVEMR